MKTPHNNNKKKYFNICNTESKVKYFNDAIIALLYTHNKSMFPRKNFDFSNYLSCDYVLVPKGDSDLIPNVIPQTNHLKEFVFPEWPCS